MSETIKTKIKNKINENIKSETETKFFKYFNFDIKYQLLSKIIKDIQLISQLIKSIKNSQLSDIIFIKGNNSYSIDSRFYFNYRKFVDFYIKVMDFIEDDKLTKVKYLIYKTVPNSNNFMVNLTLFNANDVSSKLYIEIILFNNVTLNQKILDIIFIEFNYNFIYLIEAIKIKKQQYIYFNSIIFNCEFFPLTQIIKNRKLIEYIINGKFEKIRKETDYSDYNSEQSFINVKEEYKIILKKKSIISDYINAYNVKFKINLIKIREDNMIVQYKIISDNNKKNNKENNINNLVTINIRKLTPNSSFILIKYVWDVTINEDLILSIKNIFDKILSRIEKLCKIAQQ